ncbi:Os02g0291500, partial [Oryza sativa Japonica Group]
NDCVDALQAHDDTSGSLEALSAAELKLKDILNSPSVDAACRKIDDLAEKKELDSALVLMLSKAWSAAKGTDITKSEAKDIMFHLYMTAVANLQRQMPKDIRILKHLIMIEDPEERLSALNDAFTPGPELQGDNVDTLYTSPEVLHTWASAIVDAYYNSREGTLLRQARDLMNPKIIKRIEEILKLIKDKYL